MTSPAPAPSSPGSSALEADSPPQGPRLFYRHADAPLCSLDDGALKGLRHRTVIDRATGAAELAIWQEEHRPGFLVPPHSHDCEEVISILSGRIRAIIGAEAFVVAPGESVLIPARSLHGFEVMGPLPVRLLAIFGSADPKIFRADGSESSPPWRGGSSDHLGETDSDSHPAAQRPPITQPHA